MMAYTNMKLFNSLQELWNYCSFCPLCRENCRSIDVSVGPDKQFKIELFEKSPDSLRIRCGLTIKRNVYIIERQFNCLDNSFTTEVTNVLADSWFGAYDVCPLKNKLLDEQRLKDEYFYFYIQSSCKKCGQSSTHGADLELDITDPKIGKVFNIGLELESVYLLKNKDKFHITLSYDRNAMLVSRCYEDEDGDFIESDKAIELPLVKLDFSDQNRVIDKIKTLILFS
jgi:hypothetical protein